MLLERTQIASESVLHTPFLKRARHSNTTPKHFPLRFLSLSSPGLLLTKSRSHTVAQRQHSIQRQHHVVIARAILASWLRFSRALLSLKTFHQIILRLCHASLTACRSSILPIALQNEGNKKLRCLSVYGPKWVFLELRFRGC